MTRRIWVTTIAMLTMLNAVNCIVPYVPQSRAADEKKPAIQPPPSPWEEKTGELYVTRGVSKIEKVGARYLLTTYCAGIHSVYAKEGKNVTLDKYQGVFARFHYSYVTEVNRNVRCVRAPCKATTEKIVVVKNVELISVAAPERLWYQLYCTASPPR